MSSNATGHASKEYHNMAMLKMTCGLDTEAKKLMDANQSVIKSLMKIALLCGKQGIALRGHRDDRIKWIHVEMKVILLSLLDSEPKMILFLLTIVFMVRRTLPIHLKLFRMN